MHRIYNGFDVLTRAHVRITVGEMWNGAFCGSRLKAWCLLVWRVEPLRYALLMNVE